MERHEFQTQLNRLAEQFGKNAYGTERAAILWQEVQQLSIDWFKRVVDEFIGSSRHAPLMPEFRTEISKERERLWAQEKRQHAHAAMEWSKLPPEEIKHVMSTIRARTQGFVSDEDYSKFLDTLKRLA